MRIQYKKISNKEKYGQHRVASAPAQALAALVGGGMATGWQKILEIFR